MVLYKSDTKILLVKTCEGKDSLVLHHIVNTKYPIFTCIEEYLVPPAIWDIKKQGNCK